MVNPFSVKKIKELDDNSPKKTDSKDPKTIAKLVVDGRYSIPYMPEGIYAEIRDLVYSRDRIIKQHNISANRIQRWLAIHFPEYLGLYTRFDAISGLAVLEKAPLPKDMIALGVNGLIRTPGTFTLLRAPSSPLLSDSHSKSSFSFFRTTNSTSASLTTASTCSSSRW